MSPSSRLWVELVRPASLVAGDRTPLSSIGRQTRRDTGVDVVVCLLAAVLGAAFLSPSLHGTGVRMQTIQIAVDIVCGALACLSLWWRRRWAFEVAVVCVGLGIVSSSATPAGLLALFSLAVHRPVRSTLLAAAVWIPSLFAYAAYSPTTDAPSVFLRVTPLVLTVTAWGMFIRARRQLLSTLRERAQRAEGDQRLYEDRARMAERTLIAREMHDVLGHRISLLALHAGALEVRPDLSPEQVRESAELLRVTARQALEELRSIVGLLREGPVQVPEPRTVQPRLSDIRVLIEETRRAGVPIEFDMRVELADSLPATVGRDAYRVVQEALTNVGKHAHGATARVQVTGAPAAGLHVSVRNREPAVASTTPTLPGSGAGLLGLEERVALAGGTLVHGPDATGDFALKADLPW